MTDERFAIYFAFDTDHPIWAKASSWLGRDVATGQAVERPSGLAIDADRLADLTAKAASYGFHGTLVAPFELNVDTDVPSLSDALQAFAQKQEPFDVPLEAAFLGHFAALRPRQAAAELTALHTDLVKTFAPFRAPLLASDLERRAKGGVLTEQQQVYLKEWGYPYIFEDFRFHMTLSKSISSEEERVAVLSALNTHFGGDLEEPVRADRLALYHQPSRVEPFVIREWFHFSS